MPTRSCARMRLVVSFFEPFGGQMCINLRRNQVRMAKQFLDAAQIRARIEQMGRITMTKFMRSEIWIQTGQSQVFFQPQL